jgi:hypothetical protein
MSLKSSLNSLRRTRLSILINWPFALVNAALGVTLGIADYLRHGKISERNRRRILLAHCASNGWTTTMLNLVTRSLRPPRKPISATGLLGSFSVQQQKDIVHALDRDGFYVFPQLLPESICDQIRSFAETADTVIESNRALKDPLIRYDPAAPVSRTYKIQEKDAVNNPAIQLLLADRVFVAIAERYLNTHPTIGGVDVWWSARYGNEPGSVAAQLFHFDFDAPPAWIKLFVYVTDVGPDNGPHVYVKRSHKAGLHQTKEFRSRGYERISDAEMAAMFGQDALTEITGRRGTVFMADTRGFHKGKLPTASHRLLAQLIYCSPIFNDHGVPATLPANPEPALARALAATPRVYDRFRWS